MSDSSAQCCGCVVGPIIYIYMFYNFRGRADLPTIMCCGMKTIFQQTVYNLWQTISVTRMPLFFHKLKIWIWKMAIIHEPSSIFSVLKIVYWTFFFGLIFIYFCFWLIWRYARCTRSVSIGEHLWAHSSS